MLFHGKVLGRRKMQSVNLPPEGQIQEQRLSFVVVSSTNGVKLFPPGGRMRSINLPPGGQIKEHRLSVRTPDLV